MSNAYAHYVLYPESTKNCQHWHHVLTCGHKFPQFSDDSHWNTNPTKHHGQPIAIIAELTGEICRCILNHYDTLWSRMSCKWRPQASTADDQLTNPSLHPFVVQAKPTNINSNGVLDSGGTSLALALDTCKSGPRTSAENALTSLQHEQEKRNGTLKTCRGRWSQADKLRF